MKQQHQNGHPKGHAPHQRKQHQQWPKPATETRISFLEQQVEILTARVNRIDPPKPQPKPKSWSMFGKSKPRAERK